MQALRTRTACIARQTKTPTALRQPRRFASDHHHHAEPVNESIGKGFWGSLAVIPAAYLVYTISQPGKDGQEPWLTQKIHSYWSWQSAWEERNHLHTKAVEQAGFDRALFFYAEPNRDVDVRFPEALQNSAARNIVAGSQTNLDHVVAHYKKKHLDDEERKARKLAAEQQ
ncbi:hypothetical protein ACHAQA_004247 [Verticillium albo-atrum]